MSFSLAQIQAVISDMDGVLWRSDTPLPGFKAFHTFLVAQNLPYVFATNNSSKTVEQYIEKFDRLGVQIGPENLVTAAVATALYLQGQKPGARVHVVGMPGLRETLAAHGFSLVDEAEHVNIASLADLQVDFVVAGIDWEFTYHTIDIASRLIRAGATFIGTNPDRTFPTPSGLAPGAGTVLAAIEAASGQTPLVIGKPSPLMFQLALERLGVEPGHALMIGDRLETDIQGALKAGMKTLLVCTGVADRADLKALDFQPDLVLDDLPALLERWHRDKMAAD